MRKTLPVFCLFTLLLACLFFFSSPFAQSPDLVARVLAGHYLAKTPAPAPPEGLGLSGAYGIQSAFVRELGEAYGPAVGYKAGLTSAAAQERFGVSQPLRGTLLETMLLPGGRTLPAAFGTRPLSEGDLMVRVGSAKINEAATFQEALAALEAVIPFIELPDLAYAESVKIGGAELAAVNVGARLGILGEPISLTASEDWVARLESFKLEMLDGSGRVLAEGRGGDLLDHPLKVVLWLRDSLRAEGRELKAGELLSLGSLTPLLPVRAGTALRARYTGLDPEGPVEVTVRFR